MAFLPGFEEPDELAPQAARLAPKLRALAAEGVYFGTSSWKYEGWLGSIYRRERYMSRGKFAKSRFEAECLKEYAEIFPIVCGDFAFYQFPSANFWTRLFEGTPNSLLFGFKVPEDLTVARWPGHSRYGDRAGKINPGFLDAEFFNVGFASRLVPYRNRVATLIFEFGTFGKSAFKTVDAFLKRLDPFLEALPPGFRYAVEIRNSEYLNASYLDVLKRYGVAHVLNAWTRMPEIGDQLAIPGIETADFTVVRALLAHGRAYEQAVHTFSPYQYVQEPDPGVRGALQSIAEAAKPKQKPAFLFVNNRLEGHAPTTIESVVELLAV